MLEFFSAMPPKISIEMKYLLNNEKFESISAAVDTCEDRANTQMNNYLRLIIWRLNMPQDLYIAKSTREEKISKMLSVMQE